MTATQADKAKQFRALHEAPEAFVIANVWDGGSARMMAVLGFPALATSSAHRRRSGPHLEVKISKTSADGHALSEREPIAQRMANVRTR
jgi:hypothetical protein